MKRELTLAVLLAGIAVAATACAGDTAARASIEGGEYSGVSALGQSVVIDVVGSKVLVNAAVAFLPDPTTNSEFAVDIGGTLEDFTCTNGDQGHTLSCGVKRSKKLEVKVPCNLVSAAPSPSGGSAGPSPATSPTPSPSASASASPSAPAQAAPPSAAVALCAETLPTSETISLLHLCSTAPCPDQSTS